MENIHDKYIGHFTFDLIKLHMHNYVALYKLAICNYGHMLICTKGDVGLRGSIGEPGIKGTRGDQGIYNT